MKRIVFIISLLFYGGCEIHNYPDGHTMYKFPEPEVAIVFEPEPEVVVIESWQPTPVIYNDCLDEYCDYCYEMPFDFCCAYYEYYGYHEVCKMTECLDYYTDEWYYQGEECWYE